MKSVTEKPTRIASALTVRLLFPLSLIRKNKADPRLVRIKMNAMATRIFMSENLIAGKLLLPQRMNEMVL